jgi:hypothetical protein
VGRRGDGYGSEDHLRSYLEFDRSTFDRAIARTLGVRVESLSWLAFPKTPQGDREFQGLEFLRGSDWECVLETWRAFWPTRGRAQTWDLVGRMDDVWLLVEAKASWPEFVTSSCRAKGESLTTIRKSLSQVKRDLGVNRWFDWTASYYQHANRLAALWFLRDQGVAARLVNIHFRGDTFPDGTPCPRTKKAWESLIEARRLTMGLPRRHRLSGFETTSFCR